MRKVFFYILFLIISIDSIGQKKFNIILEFQESINLSDLTILLDDGKFEKKIEPTKIANNKLSLSDRYYGKYALIILKYADSDKGKICQAFFYATQVPAKIRFKKNKTSTLNNYELYDIEDLIMYKNEMDKYDSLSVKELTEYYEMYKDILFTDKDPFRTTEYLNKHKEVYLKDLEYIKDHPNYYTFSFFRRNIMHTGLSIDSIVYYYNKIFPDDLKKSFEGKYFLEMLQARKKLSDSIFYMPAFITKDINGKIISTQDLDNKYVLFTFWATWCLPCIEEIQKIRYIHEKYKDLIIISVAYKSNEHQYIDIIKSEKMDWININNDEDLINSFGGYLPIPRLYLFDKNGKVIYNNGKVDGSNLEKLYKTLEEIFNK